MREIHLEGLSNFIPSFIALVQIQDVNPRIQQRNTKHIFKLVHAWIIYTVQFDSTVCSDDALRSLVLVAGKLY